MIKNNNTLKLSALDTGILTEGKTAQDGIWESQQLIKRLEAVGYSRFWLGEHHEIHYSWTKPSLMIPLLASQTTTIRLGTAAILLGIYPPLHVAEDYRALQTMFPNRIDFGICAAAPSCDDSRYALLDGQKLSFPDVSKKFESKLAEMHAYLHNTFPNQHRFAFGATPVTKPGDATWIMGSGMGSATLAAKYSCAYSYSLFHKRSLKDPAIVKHYQDTFQPNFNRSYPISNIALSVIAADTHEEAKKQKEWVESMQSEFKVNVFGTHESCRDQIQSISEAYQVKEVVIYMMWHVFEKRLHAFEQIAALIKQSASKENYAIVEGS